MSSRIEELFNERDEFYIKKTREIMLEMHAVLLAINKLVSLQPNDGVVNWEEISLYNDVVLMIGVVEYNPGAKLKTFRGDVIDITEQNAKTLQRLIRIGVPVELVAEGDSEKIYHFLADSVDFDDDITSSLASDTDFDLEELTEEQRISLEMQLKTTLPPDKHN